MNTSPDTTRLVRFDAFELDVRSRELCRGTDRIRLQEQPFEILRMMLERPGDVVTREELAKRLWPDGTFVDFEHSLNAAVKRLRAALGDDADNPKFVETLPRRGYRFIAAMVAQGIVASPPVPPLLPAAVSDYKARLAVLPFTNSSGEPGQEYFSDGLTEEMILQLGRLGRGRLGVIARASSMAFKGGSLRAREIGETLRADYLLEGSVRREGDRVRITAWLVETSSETHLWTDVYERHVTDCLSVQADVAARIAESLAVELLPEQPVRPSRDVSAYQSYLMGRYYWNKPAEEGLDRAIFHFDQARASDPEFAAAYADLARARTAQAEYYSAVPQVALDSARQDALRALELDPYLSDAHLAHANIVRMLDWNWEAAEAAYRQAIALNPSSECAHRWYGSLLLALGRDSEALTEVRRAVELDPLCLVVGTTAAWAQYVVGDYDAAIESCRRVMKLDGRFLPSRRVLAAILMQIDRSAEAVVELESASRWAPEDPVLLAWLAHAKALRGDCAVASKLVQALERLARHRFVPAYHLALAHAGLGKMDEAFGLLDQACEQRDPALLDVGIDPRFAPLRQDARFATLLDRLRLT